MPQQKAKQVFLQLPLLRRMEGTDSFLLIFNMVMQSFFVIQLLAAVRQNDQITTIPKHF